MATDAELKQIQIDKYTRKQAEQFGIENRLLQCTEECGELIQALSKYQRILQGDSRRDCRCGTSVRTNQVPIRKRKGSQRKETI